MFAFDQNGNSPSEDKDIVYEYHLACKYTSLNINSASLEEVVSYHDGGFDRTWDSSIPIVFAPSPGSCLQDRTWHSSLPIVFGQPPVGSSDSGRRNYTSTSQLHAPLKPVPKAGMKALPLAAYQSVPTTHVRPGKATNRREENPTEVIRKMKEQQEREARMKAAEEERRRKEEQKRSLEAKEKERQRRLKLKQLAEAQRKQELERARERQIEEEKLAEARRRAEKKEAARLLAIRAAYAERITGIAQRINRLYTDFDDIFLELNPQLAALTTATTTSQEEMQSIRESVQITERNLAQLRRREHERLQRAQEQELQRLRKAQEEAQRLQKIKEFHTVQDLRIQEHQRQKEREAIEAKAETDDFLAWENLLQQEEEAESRYYRSVYREDYEEYSKMYRRYKYAERLMNESLEELARSHLRKSASWKKRKDSMIFTEPSLYGSEFLFDSLDRWPVALHAPLKELANLEAEASLILDQLAQLFQYQGLFWRWHADRGRMMSDSLTKQAHYARLFIRNLTLQWTVAERRRHWIGSAAGSLLDRIESTTNDILDIVCWQPESPYRAKSIDINVAIEQLLLPQNIDVGFMAAYSNLDRMPLKSKSLFHIVTLALKLLKDANITKDNLARLGDVLLRSWLSTQGPAEQYHFLRIIRPFEIFGASNERSQEMYMSIFAELHQLVKSAGWREPPRQLTALEESFKDLIREHIVPNRAALRKLGNEVRQSLDKPHMQALLEARRQQLAAECRGSSSQNRPITRRDRIVENQKKSAERRSHMKMQERARSPKSRCKRGTSPGSPEEPGSEATGVARGSEKSDKVPLPKSAFKERLTQVPKRRLQSRRAEPRRKKAGTAISSVESGKGIESTSTNAQQQDTPSIVESLLGILASSEGEEAKTPIEARPVHSIDRKTTTGPEAASTSTKVRDSCRSLSGQEERKHIQTRRARKETLRQPVNAKSESKSPPVNDDSGGGTLINPRLSNVPLVRRTVGMNTYDENWSAPDEHIASKESSAVKIRNTIEDDATAGPATREFVTRKRVYNTPPIRKDSLSSGPTSKKHVADGADLSEKSVSSKQSANLRRGFTPTRQLRSPFVYAVAAEDQEERENTPEHEYEPLTYQIPDEVLRKAMLASPSTVASYWSHKMYRSPTDEEVLVLYCRSKQTGEKVAQQFATKKVLGFDIEWKSNAKDSDGMKANVSLVQLACEDRIGLFHLALHKGDSPDEVMPPTLRQIIESPDTLKCGVAIRSDCSRIQKHFGIEAKGMFELSYLHSLVKYGVSNPKNVTKRAVALDKQVKEHLQLPLYKGPVRISDWSKELDHQQCSYAAADAYASFRLFDALEAKRLALDPVPERPACVEEDKPIVLPNIVQADSSDQDSADEDTAEVMELKSKDEKGYSSSESASEDGSSASDATDPVAEQLKLLDLTHLPEEVTPPDADVSSEYETADEYPPEPGAIVQDYPESGNFVGHSQLSKDRKANLPTQEPVWMKPPELLQAEAWVAEWKNLKDSRLPEGYKARVTSSALRAYAMWRYQTLDVGRIASLMRDKPLRKSTVSTYILDCILFERLPYDGNRAKALFDDLPWSVHGKYDSIRRRLP